MIALMTSPRVDNCTSDICRILNMKSMITWASRVDSRLHLARSSPASISPIIFDSMTCAGRSPLNNRDEQTKSQDSICLRAMPHSFAVSMLLCATATSLDDMPLRFVRWLIKAVVITTSDIHSGGLMFYYGFFPLLSFFLLFCLLISELAERNLTISGHMVGSKCNLKMHVWNCGIPSPYKSGPKNHLFSSISKLNCDFNGHIFGMKHGIHNRASALQTTRGLLCRLKTTRTLIHKWLQIGGEFSPTLYKLSLIHISEPTRPY